MTQKNPIEELSKNKATWGPGPWQDEDDDYEWRDAKTGLPCLIRRGPSGALCGYVGVAPGHPFHGVAYSESREGKRPECVLEAHGGITYSDKCRGSICHTPLPGESEDTWWFGFDCSHAFDIMPRIDAQMRMVEELKALEPFPRNAMPQDIYRDVAYVKAECASLAEQLKDMQ